MGTHARIEPGGYITIDTAAWLEPRIAGAVRHLTADLRRWASSHTDTGEPITPEMPVPINRDWSTQARTWADQHGYELPEPELIAHIETRLDAEVWILRATTPDDGPIAVVGINHDPPTVYTDYCTDPWDWFDADSVEISCAGGHGWTWRTGRELITAQGSFTTLTVVFGPDLDAPFSLCPECAAHATGQRERPCTCDGTPWIVCPTCRRRCEVRLPSY